MFKIYNEGEELLTLDTIEEVAAYIREIRDDFIQEDLHGMNKYPSDYHEDYKAGDGFEDYFRDVYQVMQTVDVEHFL